MRRILPILSSFLIVALALAACSQAEAPPSARPGTWAQPLHVKGISNLYRVSPVLYRSEQPEPEGLQALAKGEPLEPAAPPVKTVVSLREFHDKDGEVLDEKSSSVHYERVRFNPARPETEDVVRFLRIVTNPSRTPVLVHCEHGADRTGMMVAMYRIVVQNWSKDDALAEMKEGGFGFHSVWLDIQSYVRDFDAESVRKQVAAPEEAVQP